MAKEKIRCENCGRLVSYEAKSIKNREIPCDACNYATPAEAKAVAKFVRTAPRKLRLVADAIRGKKVKDALVMLRFAPKRAARVLYKVVESAQANAENTYKMDSENLVVSKILIDGGPVLKRFMPRAMGRAAQIRKRTSHITVRLREAIAAVASVQEKSPAAPSRRRTRKPVPATAEKTAPAKPKEKKKETK